jgi:signal peptidase II
MVKWMWLSVLVVVLDQSSKYLADSLLMWGQPAEIFPWFNFFLAYNTGAAFSFLSDAHGWQRWFFIGIGLVAVAIIVVWLRRLSSGERVTAVALALILGGAIGNIIDRVLWGHVIDFIDWHYQDWHWPAFNIADSAISIGVALLIIDIVFGRRGKAA